MWRLHSHFADDAFVVKGFVTCPTSLPSPDLLHFKKQVTRDWAEAGVEHTIQAGLKPRADGGLGVFILPSLRGQFSYKSPAQGVGYNIKPIFFFSVSSLEENRTFLRNFWL